MRVLPGGKEILTNSSWNPLPGAEDLRLFPFTRKIDTVSSNSYIIATNERVILIDPGGLPEQTGILTSAIGQLFGTRDVPVTVLFSHVHVDHCIEALRNPWFARPAVLLGAQDAGAAALERGDNRLTQAKLLGEDLAPVRVPLRVLAPVDRGTGAIYRPDFPRSPAGLRLRYNPIVEEGEVFHRQFADIGEGITGELYHTPGHSPDSMCLRIGRTLFMGDILFAASPGMAGVVGWDQKALLSSIRNLLSVIEHDHVEVCCPGHGRPLAASDAMDLLRDVYRDTLTLDGIQEMNPERARFIAEYSEILTERLSEIFTVITGRLLYLCHILEELEEAGVASGLEELDRGALVDDLIQEFHRFGESYRAGKVQDVHIVLKAAQVVRKIEPALEKEGISAVIDPTMVRRAERLISDYMSTVRGFRIEHGTGRIDLSNLVSGIVGKMSAEASEDDEIMDIADDEEAFRTALVRRLAHIPVFDEIEILFDHDKGPHVVNTDEERLSDLFAAILEDLAGAGAGEITISLVKEEDTVALTIWSSDLPSRAPFSKREIKFLQTECDLCGGRISYGKVDGHVKIGISFNSLS